MNVVALSREYRDTQTDKDTEPIIYRSQPGDTRLTLRAGKIIYIYIYILEKHLK